MKVFGDKIQIIILFLIVMPLAKGQVSNYYMDLHKSKMNGNYLGCLKYIEENYPITKDHHNLVMYHSFVGDHKAGLKIYLEENIELSKHVLKDVKRLDSLNFESYKEIAKDSIFKVIAQSDALLINEAHHKNNHRIFLRDNLRHLYEIGYRYLFVESLMSKELFEGRKFPLGNSLTYPEPIFGELIRNALEIGFKVIPYDYMADGIEYSWQNREDAMVNNIFKMLNTLPTNKFIVFGGYSHSATNTKDRRLGFQIKEKYKTVSIDQTLFTEETNPIYETRFYDSIVSNRNKCIFLSNDPESSEFDYTLIHNRTRYIEENKPDWYVGNKAKGILNNLNIYRDSVDNRVLVQVYKTIEFNEFAGKALPVYQFIENKQSDEIPFYYNDKNTETVVLRNSVGEILFQSNISDL